MITSRTVALAAAVLWLMTAAPARADTSYGQGSVGAYARTPLADQGARYTAHAEVVRVSPRYGWHEVSEPVQQCVDVERHQRYPVHHYGGSGGYRYERRHQGGDTAASLVGGLIGGLIGNRFGGGNGRTAFTVAGAAIGASVARNHVQRNQMYPEDVAHARTVRRCTESWQTRQVRGIDGYDVTYRYQGNTFNKWMHDHPGDSVPVQVVVEPWPEAGR